MRNSPKAADTTLAQYAEDNGMVVFARDDDFSLYE
jgi:predicted nuclease of predicted toxin-antitoxin system